MRSLILVSLALLPQVLNAADWKPAPAPLMTRWGKAISADKIPWNEYPRPQLVRRHWLNLNGLWDYAIRPKGEPKPEKWDGQILVPYPIESALSGVGRHPTEKEEIWYRRDVDVKEYRELGTRIRLNFEAVDWETTVWVNGKEVGTHRGAFDPFSFDITDALKDNKGEWTKKCEILVRVWDPTEKGSQPLGKQLSKPEGIWYTPVSGIWQTVWMEGSPLHFQFTGVHVKVTDFEKGEVLVTVKTANNRNAGDGTVVSISISDGKGEATKLISSN